jgi:ParB family chromosome partitioning protein
MSRPPRGLGRGLSALLGEAPAPPDTASPPTSVGAQRNLPIEMIEPGPFQPRNAIEPAALQELAESIRIHGLLQPILVRPAPVRPGHYQIIGGERRWRAAQAVPLHEVPVIIRDLDDRQAMAAGLVENLQRQDLGALEEAEGYHRLREEFGMTQEALGQAVGKSRSHVTNTLRLLGLPDRVRELLREGALTAGHARALLTAPDPVALALQVVDRGLNVRQTEVLAATKPRANVPDRGPAQAKNQEIAALERDLSAHLGLRVAVKDDGGSGAVTIRYKDWDQLDALIRLLKGG